MPPFLLSVAIFFSVFVTWTWALPKRPLSNGESSGAGEIPNEFPLDYRPFDGPLGKGSSGKEVFNDYDLDSNGGPRVYPEDYENEIDSQHLPKAGGSERPLKPDDRIPEDRHPEDEPKEGHPEEEEHHEPSLHEEPKEEHPEEEEHHEPSSHEEPKEGHPEEEEHHEPSSHEEPKEDEETHDDEEVEETSEGEKHGSEEEDNHGIDFEGTPGGDEEEETQEGEEKLPLPINTALLGFQQVNHYIKQLEKAMEHAFKESLADAALLNNTYANTTEEEVEVDGHKYKVQKSLIETGDQGNNSSLFIESISSVNEDQPKNRSERSNPDSVPIQ